MARAWASRRARHGEPVVAPSMTGVRKKGDLRAMRKMMAVLSLVFGLVLVAGCAKPPQQAIDGANASIESAKQAGAADYAPDSLRAVDDAKAALDAELKVQQDKFALFRSYKKTDELVNDLKMKADKAAADAKANMEQAKNDATAAIQNVTTALNDAKAALDKAPKGKGTAADIEAMKADLAAAEASLNDANTALTNGSYKDAKAKADAAQSTIQNVMSQIQAAIEAKSGKKS